MGGDRQYIHRTFLLANIENSIHEIPPFPPFWPIIYTDSYAYVIKFFLVEKEIIGIVLILGDLDTRKH